MSHHSACELVTCVLNQYIILNNHVVRLVFLTGIHELGCMADTQYYTFAHTHTSVSKSSEKYVLQHVPYNVTLHHSPSECRLPRLLQFPGHGFQSIHALLQHSAPLGDSSKVFCAIASNELSLSSQLTIFDIVLSVDFVSQLFQLHVPR